jgi:hypothetical protein
MVAHFCFTYFPLGCYVKLCPLLVAILDFQLVQKATTLVWQLAMIIHDNFQFHPPCSIGEEDL